MSENQAREAALDLAWSLWTELGVPGPHRSHPHTVLDLEHLILATGWLCREDVRLADLALAWCGQHHHRISAVRLAGLLKTVHPQMRSSADSFLGQLAADGRKMSREHDIRELTVRLERPALLRLRLRALFGVSGRADVVAFLLSSPTSWVTAAEIEDTGIAKRNVAVILNEFAEGGVAASRPRRNAREFRLSQPAALGAVVAVSHATVFPAWGKVFEWMRLGEELSSIPEDKPATRDVEVARHSALIESLAIALGIEKPDMGRRRSATDTIDWVVDTARNIADGVGPPVAGNLEITPASRHASPAKRVRAST
jgi:hypothetical protein